MRILNIYEVIKHFINNRELIRQFTKRELIGRYKGSYLGLLWSVITPLFMLTIYTYFFSFVLKTRWSEGGDNKVEFALILFCGILTFNLFSEIVTRAPNLIIGNVNYVKKVVFPLEILPIVITGAAFIHCLISISILVVGVVIFIGVLNWTIIFFPIVLLPLVLVSLGLGWFFSSLGVFFRDINHLLGLMVQALMFLSPIFYPINIIPENLRIIYYFNPLSYVVEDMRRIIIWGYLPNWGWLFINTIIGSIIAILGYMWFQKTRKGFADVL